jgi:hypothetical protein
MNSGLEKARAAREAMKASGQQVERKTPLEKHLANPSSLRLAANAKCFDCVGGKNADNGFVRAIRECGCSACPLYTVRPYQRSESDAEESE